MRREFFYESAGVGKIRAIQWSPGKEPAAVIQIIHGITEHVERYDQFARYLNSKGYLVVAQDHMGHGRSIDFGGTMGYFDGGWDAAVEDILTLFARTRKENPEIPYILLGHSMGSFLARTILCRNPELEISGAILSGTGWLPDVVLKTGRGIAKLVCRRIGERTASKWMNDLIFGGMNARVERKRTAYDWLTRDGVLVDAYLSDPMCGFPVSCGLIRDMVDGVIQIQKTEQLERMRKDLPVLFLSGGDDPVGGYGEGVRQTAKAFDSVGMKDVTVKIYPLCRHEPLNEINRAEVFRMVNIWIREQFL